MKIIEDAQLEHKTKLPWLIDILLYPMSVSGIIHLAIFWLGPPLLGLLNSFVLSRVPLGIIISLVLYMLLIGYILYYFAYCVFDSSKGGYRAPDINMQSFMPDRGDLISQIFLTLGCIAVCLWPAALYYSLTQRNDLSFWLISAGGAFFLPMSLLRGIMFDAFDALNPLWIIWSILSTFLPYCGLVLFFLALGGFIAVVLPRLPLWDFLSATIKIYLLFVLAHCSGRFYWWHKDKLNWGI